MSVFTKRASQKIPATLEEVWEFISAPANLKKITPEYMGFDILNESLPEKMYAGMIISYHVKPLLGIKTLWVTEISQVKEFEFFIDEQRVGPYALWHHQHLIKKIEGGVLMEDVITYKPPFGFLGNIANTLIIRKNLNQIFRYREKKLEEIFGKFSDHN